jgi:tetratricopeptide (TPR) repeat protein
MIAPVDQVTPRLGHDLALLEASDLIREAPTAADSAFRFRHSLVQEATYASLLRDDRSLLHREVAQALLERNPEIAESQPAILALHFSRAGDHARAFEFAMRAGNLAKSKHSYEEAAANFDLALQGLDSLSPTEDASAIRQAFIGKGVSLEFGGHHVEARAAYGALRDYAIDHRLPVLEAEALNRLATAALVGQAESDDVGELLQLAVDRSRESGDPLLIARSLWNQGLRYRFTNPTQADERFGEALKIIRSPACRALPAEAGVLEMEGHVLIDLMVSHMTSGRLIESKAYGDDALAAFRLLDNQAMTADAMTGLGLLAYWKADFPEAGRLAEAARRISREIENPWGETYSGWITLAVMADRGEWSRGFRFAEEVLETAKRVPFVGFRSAIHGILSLTWLWLGQLEASKRHAREMSKILTESSHIAEGWEPWARGIQARAMLAEGDVHQAAALVKGYLEVPGGVIPVFQDYYYVGPSICWLELLEGEAERGLEFADRIIERLRKEGTDRYEAEMLYWHARLAVAVGSIDRAETDLRRAIDLLAPTGARAIQWPIHALMASVLASNGDEAGASNQRQRAADLVRSIADEIVEPPLRESFLLRPEVAALLE